MRIAIQGELGSFSHEAALKLHPEATIVPCSLSADVFRTLLAGEVDAAVIPIENSLAGSVLEHYDLLLAHDVAIEEETLLRIRHNLIALPGAALEDLRQVLSHPVALAQCRRFFEAHPAIVAAPFYDTAGSVKHAMEEGDRSIAAIASRQAASVYGAEILAAGIEDNPENYTRFLRVRRRREAVTDPAADKVSLAFVVENRPGSLVSALNVFAGLNTNLTKIESRPVQGQPWQYVFYADYQIAAGSSPDEGLRGLAAHCSMVKVLGRYRSAAG